MTARVALALVATTAASVTAIAGHHHKRTTPAGELASVIPLSPRASRSHTREPLGHVKTPRARQRPRPHLYADVDGNTYTVRDWIGSGSQFDIYGGADGCEQRAVNYGRRHLRVVVER